MRRLIPAIPTIGIACIFYFDFAGLLNTLYLSILVIFPAVLLFEALTLFALIVKTRDIRHPATLTFLILFVGTILLPVLEPPVSVSIERHTNWNRTSAVVTDTYRSDDTFKFTITGSGTGSRESLTLDSGFTNVSINGNRYGGPSLHYRLSPKLKIRIKEKFEPLTGKSLVRAFDENRMEQLSSTEHVESFKSVLETMAIVRSKQDFTDRFKRFPESELVLTPFENAVHRATLGIIILLSSVISIILYRPQPLGKKRKWNLQY